MAAILATLNLKLKGTPWLHEISALFCGPSLHKCQEILSLPPLQGRIYTAVFQGLRSAASHALSSFIAVYYVHQVVPVILSWLNQKFTLNLNIKWVGSPPSNYAYSYW